MRELNLTVLDEESIRELASGRRLKLVSGEKVVAQIVPTDPTGGIAQLDTQLDTQEQARTDAWRRLLARMEKGIDIGGFKITNRDELNDRD